MALKFEKSKYNWALGWVSKLPAGQACLAVRDHTEKEGTFTCEPRSFAKIVYQAAQAKGWKASVAVFEDRVVFAFYKPYSFSRPNLLAYPIVRKLKGEQA